MRDPDLLDRDLDSATAGRITLRPGWAQVTEPCRLAAMIAAVLTARGGDGALGTCGADCTSTDSTSTDHLVEDDFEAAG